MVTYADRLTWAMQQANVTPLELSKVMGVSKLAVRKVLDGRSSAFSAYNNAVAARFLNVGSDWLATGEGGSGREPESEAQMLARRLAAANPAARQAILALLRELED